MPSTSARLESSHTPPRSSSRRESSYNPSTSAPRESRLETSSASGGVIRLRVAGLGHFVEIDVDPTITLGDLKYIIERKTDLPAPYQRLVAKRKKMDDDTMVLGPTVMDGNTIVSMGIGLEDRTKILMLHSPLFGKDKEGIEKLTGLNKEIDKIDLGRHNGDLNNKTVQEFIIQVMCKIDCVETNGSEALRKMRKSTIKQAEDVAHKSEEGKREVKPEDVAYKSEEGNTGVELEDMSHKSEDGNTGVGLEDKMEIPLLQSPQCEKENEGTEKLTALMKEIGRIDLGRRSRDLNNKTVQELIIQVMCKIDCVETYGLDALRKMRKSTIKKAEDVAHKSEANKRGVDP